MVDLIGDGIGRRAGRRHGVRGHRTGWGEFGGGALVGSRGAGERQEEEHPAERLRSSHG